MLQRQHADSLPPPDQQGEPLQDHEDWTIEEPNIIIDLPGVGNKRNRTEAELKIPTLDVLNKDCHTNT